MFIVYIDVYSCICYLSNKLLSVYVLDIVLGMGCGIHLWINPSESLPSHSLCASEREVVNFIVVNDGSTVEKIRAVWKWDARNGYGLVI